MKAFFQPFKPAALYIFFFLLAGIFAGNLSPDYSSSALPLSICLFILLCFLFYFFKKYSFLFLLCLICLYGFFSVQSKLYPDLSSNHISRFLDFKKNIITGRVVSFVKHYERKQRLTLLCSTRTKDNKKIKVTGKIILNMYGMSGNIPEFGDLIRFESSIRPGQNFMNPGAFDYERFLKLKGIYGTAYADKRKIQILTNEDISLYQQLIRKIGISRTHYYNFIMHHTNYSDSGKIMASLVTGKKEILSFEIRDLFSKAGISHLLAISGLHLSIVSLLFFSIFYWILSYIPGLLIDGRSRKIAGMLTVLPLIWYSVFSGFSPSTQRALIMIIILLFSFVREKEQDIISSLAIAGILILIIDPVAVFSISFQLSFMAVVFIVLGLSLVKNNVFIHKKNFFSKIILMMLVTFFASLGTLPLTAHYFNMVSLISIVSNLIAIPVLGFIVLPLGLIALCCFSYFPVAGIIIIKVCTGLISFLIAFARLLVSIPFSWSRTYTLPWVEIIAVYLFFIIIFLILKGQKKSSAMLFILVFLLTLYSFAESRLKRSSYENLNIIVMDVGQGSTALIQTPAGKNILVDGGGFSSFSSFDTGRFIIAPFLWQKRIKSLEYVILTHPESDHLNGLVFILQNFKVNALIKNEDKTQSKKYTALIKACQNHNIKILYPLKKDKNLHLGDTSLSFFDSHKDEFSYNLNNNSLVFKVKYKDFTMLFPGDILSSRERNLSLRNNPNLISDILLAPHHGSSTSSSKFFLDKVQPKSVIISCGRHNRYGFPHDQVLKRYNEQKINIFRTDTNGAVFISSDGKIHNIKTYKGG